MFVFLQLISDAIRNGDCHKHTMEMADFWLNEKQLVHKLFKVLVPRYQNYNSSFTRLILGPKTYPGYYAGTAILELKGMWLICKSNLQYFIIFFL